MRITNQRVKNTFEDELWWLLFSMLHLPAVQICVAFRRLLVLPWRHKATVGNNCRRRRFKSKCLSEFVACFQCCGSAKLYKAWSVGLSRRAAWRRQNKWVIRMLINSHMTFKFATSANLILQSLIYIEFEIQVKECAVLQWCWWRYRSNHTSEDEKNIWKRPVYVLQCISL